MKSAHIIAVLSFIALGMTTGCIKSNPAQTRVQTPYGDMRYHCPPGQAKKGKCHKAGIPNVDVNLR